jgi:hypothetical protein
MTIIAAALGLAAITSLAVALGLGQRGGRARGAVRVPAVHQASTRSWASGCRSSHARTYEHEGTMRRPAVRA